MIIIIYKTRKKMKTSKDIPFGNVCSFYVNTETSPARVEFSAHPHGGPEAMWFCFRLEKKDMGERKKGQLVFKYFQNILGGSSMAHLSIVCKTESGDWKRLGTGRLETAPDGQISHVWDFEFVSESMDFALCYPYGEKELSVLLENSGAYLQSDFIGVSQAGRDIVRLSNSYGSLENKKKGIYLVARQHSGETPGSWALHGFLKHFAEMKNNDFVLWAVPFANTDGVFSGDYGKDNFPYDLNRAWERPAMRHETAVIMNDMKRWSERCEPIISLDFHAPGVGENAGVYSFVAKKHGVEKEPLSLQLAKILEGPMRATGLIAQDFIRSANYKSRWETSNFTRFSAEIMELRSLSFEFPYSFAGEKELLREDYMRVGAVIAETIIKNYS
jgi:hypothetical protein